MTNLETAQAYLGQLSGELIELHPEDSAHERKLSYLTNKIRFALLAEIEARTWRPIETAPLEKMILLAGEFDRPGDWKVKVGYFNVVRQEWHIFGASWKPTRWMPLPPAPVSATATQDPHGSVGDDVPCAKCGAALDTGLECTECGHDMMPELGADAPSMTWLKDEE